MYNMYHYAKLLVRIARVSLPAFADNNRRWTPRTKVTFTNGNVAACKRRNNNNIIIIIPYVTCAVYVNIIFRCVKSLCSFARNGQDAKKPSVLVHSLHTVVVVIGDTVASFACGPFRRWFFFAIVPVCYQHSLAVVTTVETYCFSFSMINQNYVVSPYTNGTRALQLYTLHSLWLQS